MSLTSSLTHCLSLTRSRILCLSLTLPHTHTVSFSLSLFLSLSHTHTDLLRSLLSVVRTNALSSQSPCQHTQLPTPSLSPTPTSTRRWSSQMGSPSLRSALGCGTKSAYVHLYDMLYVCMYVCMCVCMYLSI